MLDRYERSRSRRRASPRAGGSPLCKIINEHRYRSNIVVFGSAWTQGRFALILRCVNNPRFIWTMPFEVTQAAELSGGVFFLNCSRLGATRAAMVFHALSVLSHLTIHNYNNLDHRAAFLFLLYLLARRPRACTKTTQYNTLIFHVVL